MAGGAPVNLWLTVPTAGRDTLPGMIDSCGVPRDRIVVVATAPGITVPDGCWRINDFADLNIHRWWNTGIDACAVEGATHVAVVNDDVTFAPHVLPRLATRMTKSGATLGTLSYIYDDTDPVTDPDAGMCLTGSAWVLDVTSGLRPDESYRWWYGDNDLDMRARRDHNGTLRIRVTADEFVHHHPDVYTTTVTGMDTLIALDGQAYMERWG